MRLLIILAIFITIQSVISGCTNAVDEVGDSSENQTQQIAASKNSALACKEVGGTIQNVCMLGKPFCVQKHLDAGKKCNDNSECSGDCRLKKGMVEAGSKASGFCSENNNPCGCFQTIDNGVAEPFLCID